MPASDDPTASYASFEQFWQSGACSNKQQAEAIWAYWRDRRSPERSRVRPSNEEAIAHHKTGSSRENADRVIKWIFLFALVVISAVWSQWYFSSAQVFRRFSDDLGRHVNQETYDLYLHYFKALGAEPGHSTHHGWCNETRCNFSYTHSFSFPIQGTNDKSHLRLSIEISLWPSVSGVDRHLAFLSSTRWWPRGTDIYWKIESARWSDDKFDFTNWRTLYTGTQDELDRAPGNIRPLIANTISALVNGLGRIQAD